MPGTEAQQYYAAALKAGQKCYREAVLKGEYPYPQVLDEILDEHLAAGRVELGVLTQLPCTGHMTDHALIT